jgi:hypothetical protein
LEFKVTLHEDPDKLSHPVQVTEYVKVALAVSAMWAPCTKLAEHVADTVLDVQEDGNLQMIPPGELVTLLPKK